MAYLEQKVETAIPAMRYDLDSRLKGKADQRDLKDAMKEKASAETVKIVVDRMNKLEEKVRRGGHAGSSSEGGGSHSSGNGSHISEEGNEEGSDDEARR